MALREPVDVAGDDAALDAAAEPGSRGVDWIRCGWSHEWVLCAGILYDEHRTIHAAERLSASP